MKAGDDFLKSFVPPVIDWAKQNDAVVFIVWDEGKRGLTLPFYAAGAGVKANFESRVPYTHRSVVKTIQRIFGLPVLASVKKANDLADMFEPGACCRKGSAARLRNGFRLGDVSACRLRNLRAVVTRLPALPLSPRRSCRYRGMFREGLN